MIITAKFASVCPCCSIRLVAGSKVEWSKGSPARHVACTGPTVAKAPSAAVVAYARAWGRPGRTYAQDQRAYDLDTDC